MKRTVITTLLLISAALALPARAPAAAASCDRACLSGFITQYLDALVAHKPGNLAVSDKVRFTEDTVEMKLGEGLWKTASKLTDYRQEILDVREGVAGVHTVVDESGNRVMLAARLKVVDRKVTEIETMVVRNRTEGMIFNIDAVKTATPAMNITPEKSQLVSREEAIRIATLYPGGLKAGSFVTAGTPFSDDAYRFENGQLMAGPGCTFMRGCENIKTQGLPRLAGITYRVGAVDEEKGIVWLRQDFGPGSAMGGNAQNGSLTCWEMFKVYGGAIHAVEAFMEIMPQGTPSGWDAK
ncbi:MAG TPA: hypothetical protein VFY29_09730 [Terriglobia bacterium]|nr:hypothetical protein [Terriglobia bacterium]